MPMDMPTPSAATIERYEDIGASLSGDGVSLGKMFGMPCYKARTKSFAGLWGDAMVFKLTGDAHAAALKLRGSELFDPSAMGRPMKEWVVVPAAHAERWPELVRAALGFVPR